MGMVPPSLARPREEESMGYQPLPPKRPRRGKAKPKTDNPMDYYRENPVSRPATWTELLPISEHTGLPYDPRLIDGLSKKEQRRAELWFLGLPDGPQGQSIERAAKEEDPFALDPALLGENRIIPCGPEQAEILSRPRNPRLTSIIRKHGGYSPRVQPDPEEVFPLRYRSPVVPTDETTKGKGSQKIPAESDIYGRARGRPDKTNASRQSVA